MQVVMSKKYLIFKKEPFKKTADGTITINRGTEKCSLEPTAAGEVSTVPDWVADTALFKMAVEGGDVKVVEVKSPEPTKTVQPAQTENTGENTGLENASAGASQASEGDDEAEESEKGAQGGGKGGGKGGKQASRR